MAKSVSMFIDIPKIGKAIKVPTKETGIAINGTKVARAEPKNKYVKTITINEASKIVLTTSAIASFTNVVSSRKTFNSIPEGKSFFKRSTSFVTLFATSIAFAPGIWIICIKASG